MSNEYVILDEPVIFTTVQKISKYRYQLSDLIPYKSVTYTIVCLDNSDNFVKAMTGLVEGSEYDAWAADDSYIENIIKQKVLALAN